MKFRISLLFAASILLASCVGKLLDVNLFVVGEQTALEKQVLGTYGALGKDLQAYGSVRGVNEDGTLKVPPTTTDDQRAALQAMMNRSYNKEDVQEALRAGLVGEGNDGMLVAQADPMPGLPQIPSDVIGKIIEEENRDRKIVLDRLIKTTPGGSESRRPEIAWIFASLNEDLAPAKSRIQNRAGAWSVK